MAQLSPGLSSWSSLGITTNLQTKEINPLGPMAAFEGGFYDRPQSEEVGELELQHIPAEFPPVPRLHVLQALPPNLWEFPEPQLEP